LPAVVAQRFAIWTVATEPMSTRLVSASRRCRIRGGSRSYHDLLKAHHHKM
jgi:hypothetical protein